MKTIKATIKNAEIQPAKGTYKESYKITFGDGTFLYCYSREVFDFIDKSAGKELTLQLETSEKSGKDRIVGVEGLVTKQDGNKDKKFGKPFVPKDLSDREVRAKALEQAVLLGKVDAMEVVATAKIFEVYIKEGVK